MPTPRIAVIGAGMAGLSAAWRLKQGGFEPAVFEAAREPGGRSRSTYRADTVFDLGAWTFPAGGAMHDLAVEMGLAHEIVSIPSTVGRPAAGGRLRVADLKRPWTLPGTLCSWRESKAASRLRRLARELPGTEPDDRAEEWAMRQFPPAFVEDVIAPVGCLFFLQDLSNLSRDALLRTIDYLSQVQLHGFRSGMGSLAKRLASGLSIRYEQPIKEIETNGGPGVTLRTGAGAAGEEGEKDISEKFDGVIVTPALPEVIGLLEPFLPDDAVSEAKKQPYAPALLVQLVLATRFDKTALQVLPPRGRSGLCCGLTIERVKNPERVPHGHEAVTMFAKPVRIQSLKDQSDESVFQLFSEELENWLRVPRASIAEGQVIRWPRGAALMQPDSDSRFAVVKRALQELSERHSIWTAGDYLGASSLDGAVATGERAAGACMEHILRER
jgi:oxygen-dependent protoporphyrinogen oxidase